MGTNPEAAMHLVPDAGAISSLVDLLGGVLQLTAAIVTLVAAVNVRGRRPGRGRGGDDDDARR
ncbi:MULTISPECIES: hypothetical protein [Micromonospora]|uniref:hypothetical protein n=1 Tax=Micromonospora TaxID=1873 RepID=UPI001B3594C5|nr:MULTISPECIES: hypothetical protein [unclassified Micromonospora]MBQ0980742.1 hypothetical protein [Micromonospora sp. M61]MBQ1035292.1 hypothetical protein [Micromonospora sp. C81]WTI22513.1 hypothetical protein OG886_05415 [Micromonospora zamorensis]